MNSYEWFRLALHQEETELFSKIKQGLNQASDIL